MASKKISSKWVNGNLVFYDASGNAIFTVDGANRKLTLAAGAAMDLSASSFTPPAARTSTEDTYALTAAMHGLTYIGTKGSATQVISLPAPTTAGLMFTFVCGDANGEINIDPGAATYKITGKSITVAATKDLKNTAASNAVGDSVTVVSDGVDTWWIVAIQGTWATT